MWLLLMLFPQRKPVLRDSNIELLLGKWSKLHTFFFHYRYSRSWIIKISMVKCWSIPLIDSLYRYPRSIPLIDPQSTFQHAWTPWLRLDQQQQQLYLSLIFLYKHFINISVKSRRCMQVGVLSNSGLATGRQPKACYSH